MDRRDFLALTGSALTATATRWSAAIGDPGSVGPGAVTRLGRGTLDRLAQRLADLRLLDDELGGTVLRELAIAELRWLVGLADTARVTGAEQRSLFGLVAEAARLCGGCTSTPTVTRSRRPTT